MLRLRRSPLFCYGFAVLTVALAVIVTWAFPLLGSRIPFALLYAAVMLSAWYGGKRPGLAATALSALASAYFFLPPAYSLAIGLEGVLLLSIFLLVSLVICSLTDRARRAEKGARRSREQLFTTLRSIGDAVIATDAEGRVNFLNEVAQGLTGWTLKEAEGRDLREVFQIINEQTRQEVENPVAKVLREGAIVGLANHTVLIARDGQETPIDDSGAPIRDEDGNITGVVLVFRNITERRQAEDLRQRLASIVESSEDAIIGKTLEGIITSWNASAERLYGYSPEEAIGRSISLLVPPDRPDEVPGILERLKRGERIEHFETKRMRKDGKILDVALTISPVKNAAGTIIGAATIARDITADKQAERDLCAGEDRYRAFVRNSSEAIWRFELEEPFSINLPEDEQIELCYRYGYLAECNDAMAAMYGFERAAEIVGARLSDFLVRENERNVEYLRSFIRAGYRLTEAESHELDREGNPKYFLNNLIGIIEDGKLLRAWGTQRDITERQLAEKERAALLASEREARLIAERAASRTARLQAITAALSEALTPAQAASAVLGHGLTAVGAQAGSVALLTNQGTELELLDAVGFPQEIVEKWQRFPVAGETPLAEAVRTGEMVLLESLQTKESRFPHLAPIHTLNGTQALAAIPLIVEGRIIGGMGLTFKENRQFEEDDRSFMLAIARQCAQALERARLYQAERQLRNEAEAANRTKDEFLATLSHELRTPLTAMLGWTRLLQMKELDEATSMHALETVERNAKAQAQLIEDLLDVSRIITGKLRLDVRPLELVPIIEAAMDAVRPAADAKSIELHTELDPLAGPVSGDPARLQQVAWNLLANAVKFTPRGGQVSIKLGRVDSYVEITVSDTGQGITADFLPFVFDRFRQADGSTTRMHGGLGLGLAIVRHLVELHGGTVQAHSAGQGQGATFKVHLPLAGRPNADFSLRRKNRAPEASASDNGQPGMLSGVRVLVVDDDAEARVLIRTVLEKQGADVIAVSSACESLAAFELEPPDVLISDIGMPDEDGYALIRQVRSLSKAQGGGVPAAAVSAYVGEDNRRQALDAGFQLHIAKPLDPTELVTVVQNLARRSDEG
jgi:PAS domain S-box-containing protein